MPYAFSLHILIKISYMLAICAILDISYRPTITTVLL